MADPARPDDHLVVALPPRSDAPWHWWRIAAGQVEARGHGFPLPGEPAPWGSVTAPAVTLLVPAALVGVEALAMGALAPRQAETAARLRIGESGLDGGATHAVARAVAAAPEAQVLAARCNAARMAEWLALAGSLGLDPEVVLPASLAVPPPAEGAVRAAVGEELVVRTPQLAFADEAGLTEMVLAGCPLAELDPDARDLALAEAAASPPLNLRQGAFARRRPGAGLSAREVRTLARMAAAIALVTLAILVVRIARFEWDAAAQERAALAAAQARFPAAADLAAAERLAGAELARRGAGDRLFSIPVAALFSAMQPVQGISVRDLAYSNDGVATVTVAAPRQEDINAVLIALQQRGYNVTVPPAMAQDGTGSTVAQITVRAS